MGDREPGLSFIVPAYNEEESIASVLERLGDTLSRLDLETEVIVVNDGSTDRTGEVAQGCAGVTVLSHPANIGYGNAIKTGVLRARYAWVGIVDGDGSYPVEEIPLLVAEMRRGFDMVVGARRNIHENDTFLKHVFRNLFRMSVSFLNDSRIEDPNSGFRIFKRDIVLRLTPFLCGTFSFTTSISILTSGLYYFVRYVPITYSRRVGTSKVRHVRDTVRTVQYILQGIVFFNPMKFFIILALLMLLFVAVPALLLLALGFQTLSLYYFIFGIAVLLMIGMGGVGDIIRIASHRRYNDFL